MKFQGMKLLIKNDTKDMITILDSEIEVDLTNRLSQIKEKEVKVIIHYELNSESREESIVYVK